MYNNNDLMIIIIEYYNLNNRIYMKSVKLQSDTDT